MGTLSVMSQAPVCMRSNWSGHVSCKRRRVRVSPMNEANTSLANGEHGHRGPRGDDRILTLQEVLYMREWLAILARRARRREPGNRALCQLQAATIDGGDTAIADERRQVLGEVFTQPTSRCGNSWQVGPRSSLPRQQLPKRRFQRAPSRHEDSTGRDPDLNTLENSVARKVGPPSPQAANPRRRSVVSSNIATNPLLEFAG